MFDAFSTPYMQRALLEILLLAVPAGLLGSWIVLRRLAFFTHAAGTVTFPGLVVAGPWGLAPPLAALAAALGFGSLFALSASDVWLTGAVAAGAVGLDAALRRRWLAAGFEPGSARALGVGGGWADRLLLVGIAASVVVALDAVGALLVAVVLVVPAATVRLLCERLRPLQLGAVALAAVEGAAAVWWADALNVGPGPVMAVLGGCVFALVALWRRA